MNKFSLFIFSFFLIVSSIYNFDFKVRWNRIILFLAVGIFLNFMLISCNTKPIEFDPNDWQSINAALKQDENHHEALHARSRLYMQQGRLDSALIDIAKAIDLDSAKAGYYVTRADIYLMSNQSRLTKDNLLKAIQVDPNYEEAHMKLAELYLYVQMYQEALDELNEVLKTNVKNPKAYYLKGIIYKEVGDTALAISSLITTTEQDAEYALAFEQLGLIYANKGDKRALDFYDRAIQLNPKNPQTRYNKGIFLQESEEFEKAIETYKDLMANSPDYVYAPFNIGFIYFYELEQKEEAETYFKRATELNPAYAEAWFMLGMTNESLKQKDKAIAHYKKALEARNDHPKAKERLSALGVK
jgi:tetratricopeptide (TPR) repeat protein